LHSAYCIYVIGLRLFIGVLIYEVYMCVMSSLRDRTGFAQNLINGRMSTVIYKIMLNHLCDVVIRHIWRWIRSSNSRAYL